MTYTRRVVNSTFLQDTRAERPPNRGQSIIAESWMNSQDHYGLARHLHRASHGSEQPVESPPLCNKISLEDGEGTNEGIFSWHLRWQHLLTAKVRNISTSIRWRSVRKSCEFPTCNTPWCVCNRSDETKRWVLERLGGGIGRYTVPTTC